MALARAVASLCSHPEDIVQSMQTALGSWRTYMQARVALRWRATVPFALTLVLFFLTLPRSLCRRGGVCQGALGQRMSLGMPPATAAKVPKPETAHCRLTTAGGRFQKCVVSICANGGLLLWPPFSAGGPFNLTPSHCFLL
uniref:Uncharacterized protein n=1 Tax=Pipistrellus kuhlii TaxID=59472 RepID=A0A7J7TXJ4_PIPKU|nr:hypothetical protein mPipKuh1_009204 [Pipistrellus kuhlii]